MYKGIVDAEIRWGMASAGRRRLASKAAQLMSSALAAQRPQRVHRDSDWESTEEDYLAD